MKSRYYIDGWHIFDINSSAESFYIREILDFACDEYEKSELKPEKKLSIILELGLENLIEVLDDCYKSNRKPYQGNRIKILVNTLT